MKFTMQVRIPDPDWYKSIWKHTGTLGNTPCGHCRPPSCRGKMYTQHGESGTPWNLLNNFPSCTLADSHTDKYINLLSHYNDCPIFTILSAESLAALGRSRQSFSQFCSNFSSGHFAAQEGKAAHNIWRKKDKEEEGRSNSEFHRIGQTGGWLTPQEEDNSESQILWQCGKFGDIRAVWWGRDRHCGTISFDMLVCPLVSKFVCVNVFGWSQNSTVSYPRQIECTSL